MKRLKVILARLDAAKTVADMDFAGLRLHPLKGDLKGFWAVDVSGNVRVIFRFEGEQPDDVDSLITGTITRKGVRHAYEEPTSSGRSYPGALHRPA